MRAVFLTLALAVVLVAVSAVSSAPRIASADGTWIAFGSTCSNSNPGFSRIAISWFGLDDGLKEFWFDVGTADDQFAPGTFASYGPIDTNRRPFIIEPDPAKTTLYIRGNSRVDGDRWSTSQVFKRQAPDCGAPPDTLTKGPPSAAASPAVPVSLLGFGLHDIGFSEANITPDGGGLKSCEPLMFYVYFRGSNAIFVLTGQLEVRADGRMMEVARTNGLFRSGTDPMWRIGLRILGGSAMPGLYTVKFTPNDGTGPYEGSIKFTC